MSNEIQTMTGVGLTCKLERVKIKGCPDVLRCTFCGCEYYDCRDSKPKECDICGAKVVK